MEIQKRILQNNLISTECNCFDKYSKSMTNKYFSESIFVAGFLSCLMCWLGSGVLVSVRRLHRSLEDRPTTKATDT